MNDKLANQETANDCKNRCSLSIKVKEVMPLYILIFRTNRAELKRRNAKTETTSSKNNMIKKFAD